MSKVVVITGASAGIGAALARQLGQEGHSVVLAARREEELAKVVAEVKGRALAVTADVTQRADVERILARAIEAFGHVDVWVNNAGRGITRSVADLTDDDMDEILAVNLKSAVYGMQTAVRHFKERGEGHIINVSSFLGRIPVASFRSIYSASKAALNSLTTNLRMDLRASHPQLHVSLVLPGVVTTDFAKSAIGAKPAAGGPPPGAKPAAGGPPPGAPPGVGAQSADEVAAVIAAVIKTPQAEVFTNPNHTRLLQSYLDDPEGLLAQMGVVAPR
jgi:short-subunit dehydrogenase